MSNLSFIYPKYFTKSLSFHEFNYNPTFDTINDKWLINLSNTHISTVQLLLQLGHRFNLPVIPVDNHKYVIDFIKNIEKNIFKLHNNISNSIRNESISFKF